MQGFIHNQKDGGVLGDIIERYVTANETIEAGTFVEFVNGLSEGSILTTSPVNLQCDTIDGRDFEAELLTENKVIIAYYDYYGNSTTEYLKVRILTINKNQIILGDEYTLNNVASMKIKIEVLNPNSAIIVYIRNESNYYEYGYAVGISITDDGVITPSNIINFSTSVAYFASVELCKVSNTTALVVFRDISDNYCKGVVITYTSSNNTISVGAIRTIYSDETTDNYILERLTDNQLILIFTNTTSYDMIATKLSISGTTIAKSFTATLATKANNGDISPRCEGIMVLASDRFLIRYDTKYNGETAEAYVVYKIFNNNFVPGNIVYAPSVYDSLNRMVQTDEYTVFSFHNKNYWVFDIRDTYMSLVDEGNLSEDVNHDGTQVQKIASNRIFFVTDTSSYFVGQVLVVDGYKLTNEIIEGTFETQVRKATTANVNGVARTTGTGGSRTEHGETIQVYVPKI